MLELTNLNYILILIEGALFSKSFKKKSKAVMIILATQLVLLLGLRGATVGVDTHTYLDLFWAKKGGASISYLELGNRVIYGVVSAVTNNPTWIFLVYAAITVVPVLTVIQKNSKNTFFSVIIYAGFMYYYWAFNAMRQAAAMSVAFWAISKLEEEKNCEFFLFVILAAMLHKSAWIVLLFWVVKRTRIRVNKNWAIWVTVLSGASVFVGAKMVSLGILLVPSYAGYIGSAFAGRGGFLHPLLFLLVFLFILLVQGKLDENERFYLTMLSVGVILYFVAVRVEIVNRMTYYFTMPLIILLPNWTESLNRQNKRLVKMVFYTGISLYQFLLVLRGAQGIVPYRFFWQ